MWNVPDWLAQRARLSPDRVALIDTLNGDRPITYREWNAQANRTAHFLQHALGVRKGDRVAVLAKNSVAYLDIWFALAKIGGVLQNLNWRLTPHELRQLVAEGEPIALVYDPEFADKAMAVGPVGDLLHRWDHGPPQGCRALLSCHHGQRGEHRDFLGAFVRGCHHSQRAPLPHRGA